MRIQDYKVDNHPVTNCALKNIFLLLISLLVITYVNRKNWQRKQQHPTTIFLGEYYFWNLRKF